jgi:hypothetical protein
MQKQTIRLSRLFYLLIFYEFLIFRQIFNMIDVNKSGTVDFNEFLVATVLMNRLDDLGSRLSFVFDM